MGRHQIGNIVAHGIGLVLYCALMESIAWAIHERTPDVISFLTLGLMTIISASLQRTWWFALLVSLAALICNGVETGGWLFAIPAFLALVMIAFYRKRGRFTVNLATICSIENMAS